MLDGWSALTRLQLGMTNSFSFSGAFELGYAKYVISKFWIALPSVESETLTNLWGYMLFRFYWQAVKLLQSMGLGPGFGSILPLCWL